MHCILHKEARIPASWICLKSEVVVCSFQRSVSVKVFQTCYILLGKCGLNKWSTFRNIIWSYLYKTEVSVCQAELSKPSFCLCRNSGGLCCAACPGYSSWTGPPFRLGWGCWIEAQNCVLWVKSLCLNVDYIRGSITPLLITLTKLKLYVFVF